ncbi:hypothetical protein HK096_006168, partial [Nowakowskiella sp. JEL0078]
MTMSGSEFVKAYPGLDAYVGTINISFLVPFIRELLLSFGFITVNKGSIMRALAGGKNRATA